MGRKMAFKFTNVMLVGNKWFIVREKEKIY
jgi:hypothetical protein